MPKSSWCKLFRNIEIRCSLEMTHALAFKIYDKIYDRPRWHFLLPILKCVFNRNDSWLPIVYELVVLIGHKLANHHESNLTNKENYSKLVNHDIVYFCSEILWYTISYYAVWLDHDLYIILHPTHGHQWILLLQPLRLPGSEESVWISISYFCSCYYHYKSQSYKVSIRNLLILITNFEKKFNRD